MSKLLRAQISAALATLCDLALTVALVAGTGMVAPVAGASGSLLGGGVNFLLNRRWAYDAAHAGWRRQAMRYIIVWCGYVLLSYALLWLGAEVIGWHYLPVKVSVMALLAMGYNHMLHRHFVFAS